MNKNHILGTCGAVQTCGDVTDSAQTVCAHLTCADVRGDTECSADDFTCVDVSKVSAFWWIIYLVVVIICWFN